MAKKNDKLGAEPIYHLYLYFPRVFALAFSLHENQAIALVLAFFRNVLLTFYVVQMTDITLHY